MMCLVALLPFCLLPIPLRSSCRRPDGGVEGDDVPCCLFAFLLFADPVRSSSDSRDGQESKAMTWLIALLPSCLAARPVKVPLRSGSGPRLSTAPGRAAHPPCGPAGSPHVC